MKIQERVSVVRQFFNLANIFRFIFIFSLVLGSFLFLGVSHVSAVCPDNHCYVTTTGNDTTGDGTIGNPYLTFGKAHNTAANGDTITLGDGTFNTADGVNGASPFILSKNITILPTNPLGTTITGNASPIFNQTSAGATIGAIVIDALGTLQNAFNMNGSGTLTINGTKFYRFLRYGIYSLSSTENLHIINADFTTSVTAGGAIRGISYSLLNGGSVIIDSATMSITALDAQTIYATYIIATGGTNTVTIRNLTGTFTSTGASTNGVFVQNQPGVEVSGSHITLNPLTTSVSSFGIKIDAAASGGRDSGSARVFNNVVNFGADAGYAIIIGDSAGIPATDNLTNNSWVYNNTLTRTHENNAVTPHGISVGPNNGNLIWGNTITNFSPCILLAKTDSTTIARNNICINCFGSQALYTKGAVGSSFLNNTLYSNGTHTGTAFRVNNHTDIGTPSSSGVIFKNNIKYDDNSSASMVTVDNGNTAIFTNNLYYAPSFSATAFSYQGVAYATLANWQTAGHDANSIFVDPLFVSLSNFRLQPTSPAINTGTNVSITSDYLGNPIVGTPDTGAYEFQSPTPPSLLSQYKSNGTTTITSGNSTNENSVVLKFNMSSSEYNSSDLLTPQVEIQESDIPFTNTVTNSGDVVVYSGSDVEGIVTITGLESGKTYHWQARISNPSTESAWVTKGANPDFEISISTPHSYSGTTLAFRNNFLEQQSMTLPQQPITRTSCSFGDLFNITTGAPCLTTNPSNEQSSNLSRTLKLIVPRMTGSDIITLQTYLNTHMATNLITDGVFGTKTYQAVIKFQKDNNLVSDGAVGPKTRGKME